MRKIIFAFINNYEFILLTLLIPTITSCRKEFRENISYLSHFTYSTRERSNCYSENVMVVHDGILKFNSLPNLIAIYNCLDIDYISYINDFYLKYGEIDEDSLDYFIDSIGISIEAPLEMFEATLSFNSLRAEIYKLENLWLSDSNSVDSLDPDNDLYADEDISATFLNPRHEVMIGNEIYKMYDHGLMICIMDGNFATLDSIRNDSSNYVQFPNVKVVQPVQSITSMCRRNRRETSNDKYDNDKKKIKSVLSISTYPWGVFVVSKVKSFKQKNGRWKKFKDAYISTSATGIPHDFIDCSIANPEFDAGSDAGYKFKVKVKYPALAGNLFQVSKCGSIPPDNSCTRSKNSAVYGSPPNTVSTYATLGIN